MVPFHAVFFTLKEIVIINTINSMATITLKKVLIFSSREDLPLFGLRRFSFSFVLILPADTLRIYISGNNGCQIKKPLFNNFKNMRNSDKKIPANLGKIRVVLLSGCAL
jgi:hypothetical protein